MQMKRLMLVLSFVLTFAAPGSYASAVAPPSLFFSDLISGPNTGGKDNQGLFITIVGRNFGTSRGSGYVTVGGGKVSAYAVWSDTKISFQPGPEARTGEIIVITADGASNGVPFTVRSGNVYFVDAASPKTPGSGTYADPWRSPASYYSSMKAGDTCYFRAGTYSGTYGASGANFNFGSSAPQGALNNEVAFVGYPGETARLQGNVNVLFGYTKHHYVIAGFRMYATAKCVGLDGTNLRVVNNVMEGLKTQAYGIIHPVIGNGMKIYGNELFGATSGNKKDHPLYIGYGSDNIDFGWNYIHSNNVAEGPVISINTDYAITQHYKFENIRIHDNVIDCRKSSIPLRGIGIVATDIGSSVYIYNNVIIDGSPAIYQYSANASIYNNTFYNSKGSAAIYLQTVLDVGNHYKPEIVEIKNNVFHNAKGTSYISIGNENEMKKITVDSNAYYGNGNGPARDARAVNADPLFVDAAAGDFRLLAQSPLIDKGCDTLSLVARDLYGILRPQGAAADIGACEYFAGSQGPGIAPGDPPATAADISGYVRDGAAAGLAGVTMTLSGGAVPLTATTAADGSYRFDGVSTGKPYTLAPSKDDYVFEPGSIGIDTLSETVSNRNFTARRAYRIAGFVRDLGGRGVKGIEIALSGGAKKAMTTDEQGYYEFAGLPEGSSYSVRCEKTGQAFTPAYRSTTSLSGYIDGWNFEEVHAGDIVAENGVKVLGTKAGKGTVNPDNGEAALIFFKGAVQGCYECRIFTLTGELVWEQALQDVREGSFEWMPGHAASGIYQAHVRGPGFEARKKIAVVK